jgi:hypothetical protein
MTEISSASGSSMNTSTTDQARLVIVGATGMVGGYALRNALEHAAVGTVTATRDTIVKNEPLISYSPARQRACRLS